MERSYQSTVVKVPERSQCQEEEDNEEDVRNEEQEEGKKETEEEQMSERQDNMEAGRSGDGISGPLLSVQRHDHIDMPLCPPSRFDRGRCGSCETVDDSAHWTLLEPCTFRENDICRYSFICPPGRYECQESGLRWVCVVEVSLQYHYCSWENFEEQQNSLNCSIGGPLLDITVTAGHLDEIHLPHFICLGPDPSLSDRVKVLHVTDSGVSLERVCEVSRFHVKIPQPTFSPMGVVVQNLQRLGQRIKESRLRVHCHLLVFHGRKKAHLTLHIYLIPDNPALEKRVEELEQKRGSVIIHKPQLVERSLQLGKKYNLTTSCAADINPQTVKLNKKNRPSNFFEVHVEQAEDAPSISIKLTDEEETVWETKIRKGDYSTREEAVPPPVQPVLSSPPPPVQPVLSSPPPPVQPVLSSPPPPVQPVLSSPPPPVQPVPGSQDPAVEQPVPGFPSPPVQPVPGSQDPAVEFVDQHRKALIQRVSLVKPIADALLQRKLLQQEAYDKICAEKISQDQMRTLYQFLKSSTVKSALYAELLKKEPFLVKDLGAV
ncbi:hypothetical protein AGOR_G00153070 [Albula goreensis]|uniref:Uncharacterized protein n=1 Tax=Albula goreensis TaxID=1534307 RepID=A0A8T3D3X8_9TELE|nr:hypothetical protein AGOR_G00153070 [Albula goreensis]